MLKKAKLWNVLNLIITSDHGMTQCSQERIIELDQYLDREHYTLIDQSPVAAILPREGQPELSGDLGRGVDVGLHCCVGFSLVVV